MPAYQNNGNKITADPLQVLLSVPPDLQVTSVIAAGPESSQPDHVYSGQSFTVNYTVTNTGGATPDDESSWVDFVYLSPDPLAADVEYYLTNFSFTGGLAAGASYQNTATINVPRGVTGPWYVVVIADARNVVFEGSNQNNNGGATAVPLIIDTPPPADLEVETITASASAQVGQQVAIQWTVDNIGAYAASGTWTDAVYLAPNAVWNINDDLLGDVSYTGTVQPGGSYTSTLDAALPSVAPGQYRIIVRTNIFDDIPESNYENNTTASQDALSVTVPSLQLGVPFNTTLNTGEEQLYQVTDTSGQTLQVDLTSPDQNAANELYLRYNGVPTSATYDAIYQAALQANQDAVIPSTQAGTYYVLVIGQSEDNANTPVTIVANNLPFEITNVTPDEGGDSAYVTTTISGAGFDPDAIVKLVMPGIAEHAPVSYQVVNGTEIVAAFDLTGATHGLYDVEVINPDGSTAFAPYRYLVEQALPPSVTVGLGGPRVIEAGDSGLYSYSVDNNSNVDIPYVELQIGTPRIAPVVQGTPATTYNYLGMLTNLDGQPLVDNVAWDELTSVVDQGGENLSSGYAIDLPDQSSVSLSVSVQTYPDGIPPDAGNEPPEDTAFAFNIMATATPLTAAEFVAQQTQAAEQLRQAILNDPTASPSLMVLAADETTWVDLYLTALTQAGILRPADEPPQVAEDPLVDSIEAVLAGGILAGPAGNQIITNGNLPQFFADVIYWYGNDPTQTTPYIGTGTGTGYSADSGYPYNAQYLFAEPPPASAYNLNESQPTHFEAFDVYVPYTNYFGTFDPQNPAYVTPQAVSFASQLSATGTQGAAQITGPYGYGPQEFIPEAQPLPYTIQFANPSSATTAVSQVQIVEQLDPNLDPRSFRLGDLQLGNLQVQLPNTVGSFQEDLNYTQTNGFILRISAGIDVETKTLTWLVQAIDPNTGELVTNPNVGLLLPGQSGWVSYTIEPSQGLATGTIISAQANVLFNNAPPQTTPTITNMVDGVAPTTTTTVTPVAGNNYQVTWNAVDDTGGSGVQSVTVYVAEDGGDYTVWLDQTTASGSQVFSGQAGHTYQFLALAIDNAGNQEQPPAGTSVPSSDATANLGTLPTVSSTTSLGSPATPSSQPSTNPLFVQTEQGIPSPPASTGHTSEFATVLQPFFGQAFATGIGQSEAGIGPMAILVLPNNTVLASGGPDRNELFLFTSAGGQAGTPLATLPYPIFDLALDASGNVWATTGGGPLLELNAATGAILGQYGDSITQSLAIQPDTGLIYVSSGDGIEIFNPATDTFSHFSDIRVGSLAFAPDGSLWAATWPEDANDVIRFRTPTQAGSSLPPQIMVQFTASVSSIAFGLPGSILAGLLFVAHDQPDAPGEGSELTMVDLATLQQLAVATGGSRGFEITTSADGRVFISQTSQIDVLNPIQPPSVAATNPPDGAVVALPLGSISVTFDEDMLADSATDPGSVLNPANYTLTGENSGPATITGVTYIEATRTAVLTFASLTPDAYVLQVGTGVESAQGLALQAVYSTSFQAAADFTPMIDISFSHGRADALTQTYTYDVTLTNNTGYNLLTPVIISFDSLSPAGTYPEAAVQQSATGAWWLDLSSLIPGGIFYAGQTTAVDVITFDDPSGLRIGFHSSVLALPTPNAPPIIDSAPVTAATVGMAYEYQIEAHDQNGAALSYLLYSGPQGMTVDPNSGLVSWAPTSAGPGQADVILEVVNSRGAYTEQQFTITVSNANTPPVFEPLQNPIDGAEGQELQVSVSAIDPDGDALVYWAENLPPGAVFDPDNQTLTWTPAPGEAGTYSNVTFLVSDGAYVVSESTTLLIAHTDLPPSLVPPVDRTILEGESLQISLAASDPYGSGNPLIYSSTTLPAGATLDPITGVFDWTPSYDQAGVYQIPFTVSDGTLSTTQTTTITVEYLDAPPEFDNLGGFQVAEGQSLSFRAFALDPNNPGFIPQNRTGTGTLSPLEGTNPSVTYTVSGLPDGATFDPVTAMFSWTTNYDTIDGADAGPNSTGGPLEATFDVTFTATKQTSTGGTLSSSVTVPVTVLNVDLGPQLAPIANQTVAYDTVLDLPVQGPDANGAPVVLSAVGLPSFGTFVDNSNGTGQFQFAPGPYDAGNYTITLTSTDNGDGNGPYYVMTESESFVLTVTAPVVPRLTLPVTTTVALVGQPLQFTLKASDSAQDPLTFSALELPGSATLTPSSTYGQAVFQWTPAMADVGSHVVEFEVTDNTSNQSDQVSVDINVLNSDTAPVLLPVSNQTIAEGQTLSFTVQATDADGNQVTFSASNLPTGAALDPTSGVFTWTPDLNQAGTYGGIDLTASDGYLSSSTTITIDVTPVKQPPVFVPLPPQSGREGTPVHFTVFAADPDGDTLTYSVISGLPSGAQFDDASGQFTWTPAYGQAGNYTVNFGATDPGGSTVSLLVQLEIALVDRPPTLQVTNHQAVVGQQLAFQLIGASPNQGATLTYSAVGLPEGATLNPSSGQFAWTPGPDQAGDYPVQFSVSDGDLSPTESVLLDAVITPVLPSVFIELTPSFPALPGQQVTIQAIASSVAPINSISVNVDGQPITLNSQEVGTYTPTTPGQIPITASATDGDGLVGQYSTTLLVRNPSDTTAPVVSFNANLTFAALSGPTSIGGVVSDDNLNHWTLQEAPYGASNFTTIASGTTSISGTLAAFDPTTLPNGFYTLQLTAANISGLVSQTSIIVEIDTPQKPTQYLTSVTDLTVQLDGVNVNLVRQYDSLEQDQAGTFGYGWRLANTDTDIETNSPLTGNEDLGVYNPFRIGTRVYLTLPDGNRVGFTFEPIAHEQSGITYYTPAFQADPGIDWTLTSAYDVMTLAGNRFYDLRTGLPYNPASEDFTGPDYTLTGPDGTVYDLSTTRGVVEEVLPSGVALTYSSSGITASNGDTLTFVHDQQGRLTQVIAPNGTRVIYSYDANGNLISVLNLATGQVDNYGYSQSSPHLLDLMVSTQPGTSAVIDYTPDPVVVPLTANLGGAAQFLTGTQSGTLAAGATDNYAFTLEPTELQSTNSGTIFLGVQVEADAGSTLQPALPKIAGLTPVATGTSAGSAFALFHVTETGLELLSISGADSATNSGFTLQLFVAGDVNRDGKVDATDAQLLSAAMGSSVGQPNYNPDADFTDAGSVTATDAQLLASDLGFTAAQPPAVTDGQTMTHQNLPVTVDLITLASDAEGNPIYFRILSAENGTATLGIDGHTVTFVPATGYTGPASFQFAADDGYQSSAPATDDV